MVQSDRYTVFDIYKFVLSTNKLIELIKSENYDSDFVYGFIQSMDGEKGSFICFKLEKKEKIFKQIHSRSKKFNDLL